jgi:hypothetical protein
MAKPITNKVKMGQTPVIKKDLEGGVLGEANNDGTIFVDKSVKEGSPMYKEVVAHEMKHLDQMKSGQLSYDDNTVTYKGKKFLRKNGKILDPNTGKGHPEGSMKFPWEKEADKAGKKARKQGNKNNNDDMNYNKNSGLNMNVASPITKKAKGYGSPLHDNDPDKITVVDEADDIVKTLTKNKVTSLRPKDIYTVDPNNPIDAPTAIDPNITATLQKEIESGFAKQKYGFLGSNVKDYITKKRQQLYDRKERVYEPVEKTEDKLKPVTTITPGSPREQGPYEMGYYEARNKAASSRVQERESKRNTRQYKRSEAKYNRLNKKGAIPTNPTTGKPFTKREYALSRTKMVDFANPVSKRKSGDFGTTSETNYLKSGAPGTENLPTYNKGILTQPVTKGNMISSFLQNQNKNSSSNTSENFNAALSNPLFTTSQQMKLDMIKARLKKNN